MVIIDTGGAVGYILAQLTGRTGFVIELPEHRFIEEQYGAAGQARTVPGHDPGQDVVEDHALQRSIMSGVLKFFVLPDFHAAKVMDINNGPAG